jgi:uncharacterized membrane protein HdeD (DUF308 family)
VIFSTLQLSRNYWRVLLIRGIIALLFGIFAVVLPGWTILALVLLFGAYVLADGLMSVVGALQERNTSSNWWVLLIRGCLGIIAGFLVFFWPGITAIVLFILIGIWALIMGVFELLAAMMLPGGFGQEWMLVIGGILLIILGLIFIRRPVPAMLSLVWLLGIFAIVYGVVQLMRAIQYRSLAS